MPAVVRGRYLRPARLWAIAQAPVWILARRLDRRTHGWYRVPDRAAAEHVELRFKVWPIAVGDHLRVELGRPTAVAYAYKEWTEIIYLLQDGEPEPDPKVPEMAKAWAAYWSAVRPPA